jgi:hypothetical protein
MRMKTGKRRTTRKSRNSGLASKTGKVHLVRCDFPNFAFRVHPLGAKDCQKRLENRAFRIYELEGAIFVTRPARETSKTPRFMGLFLLSNFWTENGTFAEIAFPDRKTDFLWNLHDFRSVFDLHFGHCQPTVSLKNNGDR